MSRAECALGKASGTPAFIPRGRNSSGADSGWRLGGRLGLEQEPLSNRLRSLGARVRCRVRLIGPNCRAEPFAKEIGVPGDPGGRRETGAHVRAFASADSTDPDFDQIPRKLEI